MKPLVLFTPKRYLRAREAYSSVEELTGGAFQEVIDDADADPDKVRRLVLASGKMALDLGIARAERQVATAAVVRVEQLYPWPEARVASILERYPAVTTVVWAQEEPANMGAWPSVRDWLVPSRLVAADRQLEVETVARHASGSPATGSHTLHELEQADIVTRALAG
jgi:2-oxoglutarate dehydrogenase complex dehydrogenase (E1) component-like enzyme